MSPKMETITCMGLDRKRTLLPRSCHVFYSEVLDRIFQEGCIRRVYPYFFTNFSSLQFIFKKRNFQLSTLNHLKLKSSGFKSEKYGGFFKNRYKLLPINTWWVTFIVQCNIPPSKSVCNVSSIRITHFLTKIAVFVQYKAPF